MQVRTLSTLKNKYCTPTSKSLGEFIHVGFVSQWRATFFLCQCFPAYLFSIDHAVDNIARNYEHLSKSLLSDKKLKRDLREFTLEQFKKTSAINSKGKTRFLE